MFYVSGLINVASYTFIHDHAYRAAVYAAALKRGGEHVYEQLLQLYRVSTLRYYVVRILLYVVVNISYNDILLQRD